MQTQSIKCAIIGRGSVAAAVAAHLTNLKAQIVSFGRSGVGVWEGSLVWGEQRTSWQMPSIADDDLKPSLIFVCVKSYELQAACSQHLGGFRPQSVVVTVCNGAVERIYGTLREVYPNYHWRHGIAEFGVRKLDPQTFAMAGRGTLRYGPFAMQGAVYPEPIEAHLLAQHSSTQHPIDLQWHTPIDAIFYRKWLINSVVNTLCAVYDFKNNGELLTQRELVRPLFDEVAALGHLRWQDFPADHKGEFYQFLWDVVEQTKNNRNSMVADLLSGKRLEIDHLLGLEELILHKFPLISAYLKRLSR